MSEFVCECHTQKFKTKPQLQTHVYYFKNKQARIKQVVLYNQTSPVYKKYLKDSEKERKETNRVYRNSPEYQVKQKEYNGSIKRTILIHYGGKCKCCGEKEFDFLTMDHINNDGNIHRKELKQKGITNMYHFIVKNNYPNYFQILCFNCNISKRINNGKCIHQLKKEKNNGKIRRNS